MRLAPLRFLRRSLFDSLRNDSELHRHSSAVVFAPHQDDESLGCGGTIILKRDAGALVKIVFMTDGSTSHNQFMGKDELHILRNAEAIQAAEKLGLRPSDVHFLDFPDGRLSNCYKEAVSRVVAFLEQHAAEEVFVPYRADGTPDHEATHRIVVTALRRLGRTLRVCEYPVWFWNTWPWVTLRLRAARGTIRDISRILHSRCGLALLRDFRTGVFVGDLLQRKQEALAQHRSQTTRLMGDDSWPTLADVSGGEWLECFFQRFEVFHCWKSNPTDLPSSSLTE